MEIFFIFYGAIEAANAIYAYGITKKNNFNLIAILFWTLSFILIGLGELLGSPRESMNFIYFFFGITWIPMMFTPCAIKVLRINRITLAIRKLIFLIIGVAQILSVIF